MLEKIISPDNMNLAYKKVMQNGGTYGIDGITTEQLITFLERDGENLINSIINGSYTPQPVRSVKIPKNDGSFRELGIPTAIDRLVQRAVVQVLMPLYEMKFSETSYGFRPERSIEDAVKKCRSYFNQGYTWTVDMDLEKFFDSVNREKLTQILYRDIQDKRVLKLICDFMNSGIIAAGQPHKNNTGIHQGGPLSPLLANIMLNELDQELTIRGEKFVRYADDMLIFCRNKASAIQALKHITPFIEGDLCLRINDNKTFISYAEDVKFLGYGFFLSHDGFRICVHEDSLLKLKEKLIKLARHIDDSEGQKNFRTYLISWIAHYRLADLDKLLYDCREFLGWEEEAALNIFAKIWLEQQSKI